MERERPEKENSRPNATYYYTESGNKVYVVGTSRKNNKPVRVRVGKQFVKVYDKNFTAREQRMIGNLYYNIQEEPDQKRHFIADTGLSRSHEARRLNRGKGMMCEIRVAPDARDNEEIITHELIHAKTFMRHRSSDHSKHNERKIDYEAVGRVSPQGLFAMQHGYYFSTLGNQEIGKRKYKGRRNKIVSRGILHDRLLLTGSIKKSLIGKPVEKRVNKTFKRSFFFKRDLSPFDK